MAKTAKATSGAIGKVAIIYGDVKAISPDGTVRILGPNSPVFAEDQIITGGDGSVSLILDGTPPIHLDLGRMTQITLDEDVYGGPASTADAAAEADKVQQALLAGDQPIQPEAPAAGGEANAGGGHPVVDYSLTGEEVTPDSGAETRGIEFPRLEEIERAAEPADTSPMGGSDEGAVDEDGLEYPFPGNPGGPGDHPAEASFMVGKLSYNFGDDGPAAVNPFVWSMDGLSAMGITSQGHTLLYEVVDGGLTLNAYYGGSSGNGYVTGESVRMTNGKVYVFTVELTNVVTGEYQFTLFQPLDHPLADTEDDINYVFGYTLKDSDGDTGHGVLRMLVDDDSPVVSLNDSGFEPLTVDESALGTDATASFAGLFTGAYGADGAGSISYSLGIGNGGATDLVDTATGEAVVVSLNGSVIEGKTATSGDLVFTVTVDSSGNVTLDQIRAVVHSDTADPDDATTVAGSAVTLTATITDKDGDTDTATANIGSALTFKDDGPSIELSELEDKPTLEVDETNLAVNDSADFASLFTGAYGADGAGTTTYALGISASGVDSGLVDTATGNHVYLFLEGGAVVGRAGTDAANAVSGVEVFEVTLSGSTVTLDQIRAVVHGDTTNPDDATSLTGSAVTLTATITDKDGDTDTATANIGSALTFKDDGPSAANDTNSIAEDTIAAITGDVLANDLAGADSPAGFVSWASTTATYGTFTNTGNGTYSYVLDNTNSAVQALDDGETLTETFTYTMKDADGDTATATLTITITGTNDVPGITVDPGGQGDHNVVYESDLSTGSNAGGSGEFAYGTFTVSDADGLDDIKSVTINGTEILIANLGTSNVITGAHGTLTVISYDAATGVAQYKYELTSATTDVDGEMETDKFTLTVSDGTAVSAPATITIEIVDDVPTAADDGLLKTVDDNASGVVIGTTAQLLANDHYGADGAAPTGALTIGTGSLGGTITIDGSGNLLYTSHYDVKSPYTPATETFTYTIKDGDGDTTTATFTVELRELTPNLIVGSAKDDITGSTDPFVYGDPGDGPGVIRGGGGNDVLIGDPGGSTIVPGTTANVIFVLDVSGSMSTKISFGNTTITRMQALQNSVNKALDDLYASGAENVRVHIVKFSEGAQTVGTYDLTLGGADQAAQLASAKAAVSAMSANGSTNYEAGLQKAINWLTPGGSDPLPNATVNKLLFISDGEPNYYVNNSGSNVSGIAQTAVNQCLGIGDSTNEVGIIENTYGFTIESIGINVGNTALGYLSQMEGPGGAATNVTSAEQLTAVVGELVGSQTIQNAAGNDTIEGGDGDDILFGDVPFTDVLADSHGLTTPDGAGWLVFQQLGWTEQQIMDYIKINHAALGAESGRTGGNDTIHGGAGNDIIYGQEGNDTLYGDAGNDTLIGGSGNDTLIGGLGDDILSGGTGNDTLTGGAGADIFVISHTGTANLDHILDYSSSEGDKIDLSALLDGVTNANKDQYIKLTEDPLTHNVTVSIDANGSIGGQTWTDVAVLDGYGTSGTDHVNFLIDGVDIDKTI